MPQNKRKPFFKQKGVVELPPPVPRPDPTWIDLTIAALKLLSAFVAASIAVGLFARLALWAAGR